MCRAEWQGGGGSPLPGHPLGAFPVIRQKKVHDHSCLFFLARETEAQRGW